jgi:hypothetical protein
MQPCAYHVIIEVFNKYFICHTITLKVVEYYLHKLFLSGINETVSKFNDRIYNYTCHCFRQILTVLRFSWAPGRWSMFLSRLGATFVDAAFSWWSCLISYFNLFCLNMMDLWQNITFICYYNILRDYCVIYMTSSLTYSVHHLYHHFCFNTPNHYGLKAYGTSYCLK